MKTDQIPLLAAVGFILQAFCWNLTTLYLARVWGGVFANSLPIAQACITDVMPMKERPKYLGLIGATIGIAFTLGPGLGAFIFYLFRLGLDDVGAMRGVLFVCSGVSVLSCSQAFFRMEETRLPPTTEEVITPEGTTTTTTTTTDGNAEELDVEQGGTESDMTVMTPVDENLYFVGTAVCLLSSFFVNWAFTAMQSMYPIVLTEQFGWGSKELGAILVSSGFCIAGAQGLIIKPLVDKVGKHGAATVGAITLGIGMSGYTAIIASPLPKDLNTALHLLFFGVHVIGYSIANTAIPALISRYTDESTQGRALGLNASMGALSRVASPLASGALFEVAWQWPFYVAAGFAVLAALSSQVLLVLNKAGKVRSSASDGDETEFQIEKQVTALDLLPAGEGKEDRVGEGDGTSIKLGVQGSGQIGTRE